ncbi:SNF2 family N-terminal domain-containing protein [Pisolithus orientalis]|uniref:SNF2 family N-terminal domain-containing protein n=1 Tax=Pisolithus orientalis TaxID=936130 RepID=UPI00222456F1|nr:SNF2 family N-terminal domain-containing protein [Pisolithus orientalis]KAI6002459.1 SNF2 family N-terminal domain-containing protein [Pisolithus orientalis]
MDPTKPLVIPHTESLRRKPDYYWPGAQHYDQYGRLLDLMSRPALNLHALMTLINKHEEVGCRLNLDDPEDDHHISTGVGEKRRLATSATSSTSHTSIRSGRGKHRKVMDEHAHNGVIVGRSAYPFIPHQPNASALACTLGPSCSFLPAFHWSVDISFVRQAEIGDDHVDDASAETLGWLQEEEDVISLVKSLREGAGATVMNLGSFYSTQYRGHNVAITGDLRSGEGGPTVDPWLFLFPKVEWPDGLHSEELHNYGIQNSNIHADFLLGCRALQEIGHARIDTNLEMHVLPQGSYDPALDMPFRLRAKFSLSLVVPNVYEPIPADRSRRPPGTSEGLRRRITALLGEVPLGRSLSSKLSMPGHDDVRDVTIPFFFGVLRSAPQVASGVDDAMQPDALNPTLLPFQRRTVAWMLNREGKDMMPNGKVVPRSQSSSSEDTLLLWEKIVIGGKELFFNRLSSMVRPDPPEPHSALGGILAEEPGLGKTIECIALMLLNPAPERNPTQKRWDPEAKLYVKEIKTTLVITPPSLAQQWVDELSAHAPSLKVLVYDGWSKVKVPITEAAAEEEREKRRATAPRNNRKAKGSEDDVLDWCTYVNQFDVCVTTYNVLRLDMVVARAPPKRPRRQDVTYSNLERPRSPLVMCEWYRVIMDEVQMMGAGKSEEMVSLVPRLSSFAVSGTPAKAQVADLIRVLRFLRVDAAVGSTQAWQLFLKHGFKDQFAAFFQHYAVRTLKSAVNDELTIPQQRRYLVGIDLGPVERQVYDQVLEESLAELGLDARGVATYEGWQADTGVLRNVLRRLRGLCTHPQVGQLQRQGDKLAKTSALKSMSEVLEALRDQHWRCLMDDRKAKIHSLVRLAQLQQHCQDDRIRYQQALNHLLAAENEVNELITEVQAAIAQHHQKGEALKKAAQALRESRKQNLADQSQPLASHKGKEKETGREPSPFSDDGDEDEVEDRGLPNNPAGEEHRTKRHGLQQRLRECWMILHRVKFLQGDVYHVLGPSLSEQENACYTAAETLRRDLLKSVEGNATKAMLNLHIDETARGVTEQELLIKLPHFTGGGIKSTHLFEEANMILQEQLNEQTTLIWQWRTKIITLLTQKLSNTDDQADGEEYARALDTQGEAEVYMQAYAALLADRREALLAERTLLAAHESREKKERRTRAALDARIRDEEDDALEIPDDVEVQPQHEVLHKSLNDERTDLRLLFAGRALKSILVDLSAVVASIPREEDPEKLIAKDGVRIMRGLISTQTSLMDRLDADLAQIRKTFNERIIYFRQLQDISDSVVDVVWEGDVRVAMNTCEQEYRDLGRKIATGRARHRYLENLGKTQGDGSMDEDDKTCVLCRCDFLQGFITPCGHIFCKECLTAWLARKKGGVCPVCRASIEMSELHRFTIQDEVPPPPKPVLAKGELPYTLTSIGPSLLREIQQIESIGSYGSKIQTLVRHLLHIQVSDPGSKSIVFSAWADSLHIIEHAFRHNGIPSIRLDKTQGNSAAKKFRTDPTLEVLLLHGERDNAGLNVTCASRVFLVESVVNHGFEIQAIARIDRMGQKHTTEDTVEKNILDLAARQGLSLYTKDQSAGSINVTRFATDASKKLIESPTKARTSKKNQSAQKGDFIFKVDDMLAILFPHMFEDIEYLIPPGAEDHQRELPPSSTTNTTNSRPRSSGTNGVHINAEAGPSRIPM